jgi:hypothetical protein
MSKFVLLEQRRWHSTAIISDCENLRWTMNDFVTLAVALGFGITAWLFLVLSDLLMGDKPQ